MRQTLLGCLLLAVGVVSDGGSRKAPPRGASARLDDASPAERGRPQRAAVARGQLEPDPSRTARVVAPLPGRVEQVEVHLGERVQRGQRLAAIASPDFVALTHERAQAQLHVTNSARLLRLQETLFAVQAVSMTEVLRASAQLDADRFRLRALESRLHGLRVEEAPGLYWLTAPRDGAVVSLRLAPGQRVSPRDTAPLLTLSDLSGLVAVVHVLEREAAAWPEGETVQLTLPQSPGLEREGLIEYRGAVVDPLRRMVAVHVRVPNADGALRLNAFVEAAPPQILVASDE